jgi:hypothetical protein
MVRVEHTGSLETIMGRMKASPWKGTVDDPGNEPPPPNDTGDDRCRVALLRLHVEWADDDAQQLRINAPVHADDEKALAECGGTLVITVQRRTVAGIASTEAQVVSVAGLLRDGTETCKFKSSGPCDVVLQVEIVGKRKVKTDILVPVPDPVAEARVEAARDAAQPQLDDIERCLLALQSGDTRWSRGGGRSGGKPRKRLRAGRFKLERVFLQLAAGSQSDFEEVTRLEKHAEALGEKDLAYALRIILEAANAMRGGRAD